MGSNASLGEAVLDLVADGSGLTKDIDSNKPAVMKALDGMGKLGGLAFGTALAGAAAVGGFLVSSIGPASDLNETISKTETIFGDSANAILEWSETSAEAMGQSRQSALDAVSGFGTFAKAAGLAGGDLESFVTENAGLASDLASFWNTSTEQAQTAIQALFRGETEPIRAYGVMVDDATMRQKAFELGIISSTKDALTPQQKILAANALLWEQTGDAQGDFARTSDGLANKQRILAAQFEDIRANLGTALLPAVQAVATAFSEWMSDPATQQFLQAATMALADFATFVVANIPTVIATFESITTWLGANQGVVVAILAVLGAAFLAFGVSVATAAWAAISPLLPIIAVIALIGAAAYLLYEAWTNNWGGIRDIVANFWAWLQPLLQQLWNWLATNVPAALATLSNYWTGTLLPAIMAVWGWMNGTLFPFLKSLGQFIGAVLGVTLTAMAGIWKNVLQPALMAVWTSLSKDLMPIFKAVSDWWKTSGQPMAKELAHWFGVIVVKSFEGLNKVLKDVTKWLADTAAKLNSLKLPAWMTPGSPTPWEIGLWGVEDALKAVTKAQLPALKANLGAMSAPAVGTGGVALQPAGGVQFNYAPMFSTADRLEAQRAFKPFMDSHQRGREKN